MYLTLCAAELDAGNFCSVASSDFEEYTASFKKFSPFDSEMSLASACERFVTYQTGRCSITEGWSLNIYHKKNLRPHFYNKIAKERGCLVERGEGVHH